MNGENEMTSRQTAFMVALQSIGARLHEITDRSFLPEYKSLFLDFKEFKNGLEFYFKNRVEEII